ncbi:MAG TPA: thermonuclease family protein [Candidatus Eisenbacteria bacterium]|jgi:endonuclease YncB( thermonuclease family)
MNLPLRKSAIRRAPLLETIVLAMAAALPLGPPASPGSTAGGVEPAPIVGFQPTPPLAPAPQPRPHGVRARVPKQRIQVKDGDTIHIRWSPRDVEPVRILGIDAPEIRDPSRGRFHDQPYGRAALRFARRAFGSARTVEILRAATLDPYRRTLAYVFLDGRNYSVLLVTSHLAEETVSRYGSNGFPREAAAVRSAARRAGPPPFESPRRYRRRAPQRPPPDPLPLPGGSGRVPGPHSEANR